MSIIRSVAGAGCLVQSIVLAIYGAIGWWSIDTITNFFGKDLPWIADVILGFLTGWVSFWIAIVLWLVS